MESIVGQTVSHYEFLEKLGSGGMGEIYKARDSRLNRIVAVKVLAPGRTRDPERRRRFIQEAQAASGLNHPNIITIHDILPEGDTQYMVMEYVAGKTLHALIRAGRLPVPQALQISTQMANALAAAHAAGIIHRDLKPANVMVTGSGLVKILDFGLAKLMDPTPRMRLAGDSSGTVDPVTLTAAPLTVEGSIMGTVNYMSPEQAEGLKLDARSDIFSFGAVLYEMVTGRRAFEGDSAISTLSAVLRDEVKPIREIAPEVPAELDNIIARCLRKNPDDRWQKMTEVAAALSSLRARVDSGVLVQPAATPAPIRPVTAAPSKVAAHPKAGKKKLLLIGSACVALIALAAAGGWWQTHQQKPAPQAVASAPPAPQLAPTPAPVPETNADAKNDALHPIEATPAPPPASHVILPATKAKTPALPPIVVPDIKRPVPAVASTAPPPVVAAPVSHAPAPAEVVPVKLNDGWPFRIALQEDVPSNASVGHTVRFRVVDGLKSGDVIVIAKGAIVIGSVAAVGGKRNFFGERSKVRFRLISADSVDDSKINVRATPAAHEDTVETRPFETPNGSKESKDKNVIAASGTEYIAYVAGEQTVHVHK